MRKTFGIERRSFLHHFDSEGVLMSGWHFTAIDSHSILSQDLSAFQRIAQYKKLSLVPGELGGGFFADLKPTGDPNRKTDLKG